MTKSVFITLSCIILLGAALFVIHQTTISVGAKKTASPIDISLLFKNLPAILASDHATAFHYEKKFDYFGSLELTGYAVTMPSPCGKQNSLPCNESNKFDYTFFYIVNTTNDAIASFLRGRLGKSFVAKNGIGLGCYSKEEGRLFSDNFGDYSSYFNLVSGKDLDQLMASGPKNYIRMRVTRPIATEKKLAPYCYSLFRDFVIIPNPETPAAQSL